MSDLIDQSNNAIAGNTSSDANRISTSNGDAINSSSAAANNPSSATMTITEQAPPTTATQTQDLSDQVLTLTLQDRVGVQWDEEVIDNEGMGRKSSKRCCIFHKPRAFGESSTDSSDYDSSNENGKYSGNKKKIAHKKLPATEKVPDHLKWHA